MLAPSSKSLSRILAIRLDNIGDVVMTGPALRALRTAYPPAQITLMASPAGAQVYPLLPWVDTVLTWRAVWQDIARDPAVVPEKETELVQLLQAGQFDAAFIFTSFSQSPYPPAYACYLAGIPLRVGQSREFGGGVLSHWIQPLADQTYQVDRNLHLLRSVGIPVESDHLELLVQPADQSSAGAILMGEGIDPNQPFLVLAPGASCAARRYDDRRFASAVQRLAETTGWPVVLLGSQREAGQFPVLEDLANRHPRVTSLIGQTSVPEMADMIRRSSLLIANNSGAMHIGAALNRPMVLLFSGTELLEQFAPRPTTGYTAGARILNQPTHCTPCHSFQCRYHMECLDIQPEEIVQSALTLLEKEGAFDPGLARSLTGLTRR